jgi:hypothetical protein
MTQIARYAQYRKIEIKSVKGTGKLNLTLRGSVIQETLKADATSIEINYAIESDAPADMITRVLKVARNGCWARAMVRVPIEGTVMLNGKPLEV